MMISIFLKNMGRKVSYTQQKKVHVYIYDLPDPAAATGAVSNGRTKYLPTTSVLPYPENVTVKSKLGEMASITPSYQRPSTA